MAYRFYLGNILLPVTPESVDIKMPNQNSTITLIDGTEHNFLKTPGLREVSFDFLLPAFNYPFAIYENGFKDQKFFTDELKRLKELKEPFRFSIKRELPDGKLMYDTDFELVSIEDYSIKESADNGFDITVSISLKEYLPHETAILDIAKDGTATSGNKRAESSLAPTAQNQSYTVKKGDTLWALAKFYYGDGSKYRLIASANKEITNPNLIYPGQVIVIPKE